MLRRVLVVILLAVCSALAQTPELQPRSADFLTNDQLKDLIRRVAEHEKANHLARRNYTYMEREVEKQLDGDGRVKKTEITAHEIMILYGERVERLVAKEDKPLSDEEARKEEERIQKIVRKHADETPDQKRKRDEEEAKRQEQQRDFLRQIDEAYDFKLVEVTNLNGRPTYVIDAEPRREFKPKTREGKFLSKFRFRVWIDKAETQWVKLDAEAIDNITFGVFLARISKGGRIHVEQTRVNDEVWLPKQVNASVGVRILFKGINVAVENTYSDYKKFRTDTKVMPVAEATPQPTDH